MIRNIIVCMCGKLGLLYLRNENIVIIFLRWIYLFIDNVVELKIEDIFDIGYFWGGFCDCIFC